MREISKLSGVLKKPHENEQSPEQILPSQPVPFFAIELSLRKGHEYVSVFADLVKKRVLFATEGRDHQVWVDFVAALGKHNGHRHAITQVSLDMSPAYQKGVQETCRNAQVVFDKFHVLMNVNKAVDQVRRAEVRLGGQGVWEALHKSQWLWRKNPANLTEREAARLAGIDQKSLRTTKAYQMRLVLQDIYQSPTATVARHRLRVWIRWVRWVARQVPQNLLRSMVKAAEMIERQLLQSHVINDHEVGLQVSAERLVLLVEGFVLHEVADQIEDGTVEHEEVLADGFVADGLGQMGFADARWPEEQNIFGFADKSARGQIEDLLFVNGRIKTPVEVIQGFQVAEVRQLGVAFHLPLLPDVEFVLTDEFEELGVAEAIRGRFLQAHVEGLDQAGEAELFQAGGEGIHVWLMVVKQSGTQSR